MGDTRVLTEKQLLVHLLDLEGLTPTQIAKRAKLSVSRVANIKTRLRQLGFAPAKFRRRPEEMPPEPVLVDTSDIGTDADELPDPDEPQLSVSRCHCGLALPCYHAPVSAFVNPPDYQPSGKY